MVWLPLPCLFLQCTSLHGKGIRPTERYHSRARHMQHVLIGCTAGGLAAWAVLLIVASAAAILAAGGFAVYKYHIRSQMNTEIRAIMSQYMPLESDGTQEEKETLSGA